jgi:hypothetical protein
MMTLRKDNRAPVKNDLLHVGLSSTSTHTVNTPLDIQARGFTSPREAPPPTVVMGQDGAWQEALSPRLMATGHRMVQRAG